MMKALREFNARRRPTGLGFVAARLPLAILEGYHRKTVWSECDLLQVVPGPGERVLAIKANALGVDGERPRVALAQVDVRRRIVGGRRGDRGNEN